MINDSNRIWTNAVFPVEVTDTLRQRTTDCSWLVAKQTSKLNLVSSPPDGGLSDADIAFGQPDALQLMQLTNVRWVHLTSAGYTSYDRDDLKTWFRTHDIALTTSSGVYDEPCAQHALSMMMAFARQLPYAHRTQLEDKGWPAAIRRENSFLLNGQTVVLVGFGEIGKRLTELLAPFRMKIVGVRRFPRGDESIPMLPIERLNEVLPDADHVMNILPANDSTMGFFTSTMFRQMKRGAYFYNIGRGVTVDQVALENSLREGRLAGAYLDVTSPEPLDPTHPLWTTPNCFITPHTAGGFRDEMMRLAAHFLENLERFRYGKPLLNRVI